MYYTPNKLQHFSSIDLLVSEILISKLILIYKFQNILCALGFEVKHSKVFFKSLIIKKVNLYGQYKLFIVKSVLKIILHILQLLQKNIK